MPFGEYTQHLIHHQKAYHLLIMDESLSRDFGLKFTHSILAHAREREKMSLYLASSYFTVSSTRRDSTWIQENTFNI